MEGQKADSAGTMAVKSAHGDGFLLRITENMSGFA